MNEPRRGEVGEPDADGVAVGCRRQIADQDSAYVRLHVALRVKRRDVAKDSAANHVCVHAGAADLLAYLIDDEEIDVWKWKARK